MCGIFGVSFKGHGPVGEALTEGLKLLEYRGYDSVGIAVSDGRTLHTVKDVGSVATVSETLRFASYTGVSGIGHTRWATHGKVSPRNAHPHLDCTGTVAVVHNGIIDNHAELREWLERRGHTFTSETDSEVIAHLLEEFGADEEGMRNVMSLLKGTYAFAALLVDGTILCAKRGSPLVAGASDGVAVVASDPLPILRYTDRVVRLNDGESCVLKGGRLLYRGSSTPTRMRWKVVEAELGGYAHYMEKEIREQPAVLRRLVEWLEEEGPRVRLRGRVHLVAAGTSYHAALYGEYILKRRGVDAQAYVASEYREWAVEEPDIILAISQSGETADVIEAVKERESELIVITNVPTSTLAHMSDTVFLLNAGPELGVAATKTYTSQLLTLYHIATGRTPENVPSLVYETLIRNDGPSRAVAKAIAGKGDAFYLGRGLNLVTAMEGALKLKEIAYIHAEAYPAGESKHGPIALVEPGFPVFFVAPKDGTYTDTVSNVHEMVARGAEVVLVSQEPDVPHNHFLSIPYVEDPFLHPIVSVVPLQLVAYHTSVLKGLNPDRPRNLAKSVTVK